MGQLEKGWEEFEAVHEAANEFGRCGQRLSQVQCLPGLGKS